MKHHTDFGYINCLMSNGETEIINPDSKNVSSKWLEINLRNRTMFQAGACLQVIKGYYAIPHGMGRSRPLLTIDGKEMGKVSIVGVCDPKGEIELVNGVKMDAMKYTELRFKGLNGWNTDMNDSSLVESMSDDERLYRTYLCYFDNF
jgi:hypothetical protein